MYLKMYTRKLVKAGPSSHTIALPKEWLQKNKLKKGDFIYVAECSETQLLLSPKETQPLQKLPKEKLIEIDDKDIDTIQREITSAYLNNYSLITLAGNSVQQKAKAVREIVHDFVALEITEQNTKKISAKDFLNLQEISVDKTIKRIDMMIRTMFEDILSKNQDKQMQASLELRDEDINRLYFLLVRLLKSSLDEPDTAKQLELQNKDILLYWQLVHDLESIADHIKQANELTGGKKTQLKNTVAQYTLMQQTYLEAMQAHYNKDKSAAEKVLKQCIKKTNSAETNDKITALNAHIANIARQVIDTE